MPEVIIIGLTNDARKFLKSLSKLDGKTQEMQGRNIALESGRGTVDGVQIFAHEQVQVNHNTGKQVYVFHNLLIRNGNREFESFSWTENPLLNKVSDAEKGQYNLEKI